MSFEEKAAKLAVNYAVNVKSGDIVAIRGEENTSDLIRAIYVEVLKTGAHPVVLIRLSGLAELKYKFGSDQQVEFVDPQRKLMIEKCDKLISIRSITNSRELELADPDN